jgi:hypothetical protein
MLKGVETTIHYWAVNSDGEGVASDVGNHTLRILRDSTLLSPSNSPAEVDGTYLPGCYRLTLTAAEANGSSITVGGISSTSGVKIIPFSVTTENGALPNAAAGASGGLVTGDGSVTLVAGSNNWPRVDARAIGNDANSATYLAAMIGDGTITANLSGSVDTVTGAVGSVTVVSDKTGYTLGSTQSFNNTGQTANLPADVQAWNGDDGAVSVGAISGLPDVNVEGLNDSTVKAGYLEAMIGNGTITADITGGLSGSVGSVTGSVGSISGVTFPSNFGSLAITGAGVVDADVESVGGNAVTSADDFKADVSGLSTIDSAAVQAAAEAAINATFSFIGGDVVATLDSETVALSAATEAQIDAIADDTNSLNDTKINAARLAKIDALPDSFPDHFADLAITDTSGRVTVGSWGSIEVSVGVSSGLPIVDAQAISDSGAAADAVQANIANLDAAITSRAPASTALSSSTWTAARAGYLDKLNVGGDLANTDNASSFMADVSALATAAGLATVDGNVDTLLTRVPEVISLSNIRTQADDALTAYDALVADDLPPNFGVMNIDANGRLTIQGTITTLDDLSVPTAEQVKDAVLGADPSGFGAGTAGYQINLIASGGGTATLDNQQKIIDIVQSRAV